MGMMGEGDDYFTVGPQGMASGIGGAVSGAADELLASSGFDASALVSGSDTIAGAADSQWGTETAPGDYFTVGPQGAPAQESGWSPPDTIVPGEGPSSPIHLSGDDWEEVEEVGKDMSLAGLAVSTVGLATGQPIIETVGVAMEWLGEGVQYVAEEGEAGNIPDFPIDPV